MMEFLQDLWGFLKHRKKFWLLPLLIVLLVLGGLVVLTSGTAIAPFIYTLF
jgi:competence protein ComGC